jgi:hypothetical protein
MTAHAYPSPDAYYIGGMARICDALQEFYEKATLTA